MGIYVVDTIMGGGKTEAAIAYMEAHPERKFIFVTPFLTECERIISSCKNHEFYQPLQESEKIFTKTAALGVLLESKKDIVMSHSLFLQAIYLYEDFILDGEYVLIQDETLDLISTIDFAETGCDKGDVDFLIDVGLLSVTEKRTVKKNTEVKYEGRTFKKLIEVIDGKSVISYKGGYYTLFNMNVFRWFTDVYILTYLFKYSNQRCMMDIKELEYETIGARLFDAGYRFTGKPYLPEYAKSLIDRIQIENSKHLNSIGDDYHALSSSWYNDAIEDERESLKRDVERNSIGQVPMNERSGVAIIGTKIHSFFDKAKKQGENYKFLWTSYKKGESMIETNGYRRRFLSCNQRASNQYSDRNCLAYCVNVFPHPHMIHYFEDHGVKLDRDGYALSEMVQWVWRSAIRTKDGTIRIYIPSRRMRLLFTCWLEELRDGGTGANAPRRFRELLKEEERLRDNEKDKIRYEQKKKDSESEEELKEEKKSMKKAKKKPMGKRAKKKALQKRMRKLHKIGEFAEDATKEGDKENVL